MRFIVKKTSNTFSDPWASVCDIGKFDGTETMFGDLCFMRSGIENTKTFMNHNVLREVLLSDPKLIEETTGVKVMDIKEYNTLIANLKNLREKLKQPAKRRRR
jgi:hypothetical protein